MMPALNVELEASQRTLPEVRGGWFFLSPKHKHDPSLICEQVDDHTAVLTFGTVLDKANRSPAKLVHRAYSAGGISAVCRIDGCYSAVVVDRASAEVFLVSDIIGQRSLRYFINGDRFFVSPHDITLVATGLCSLEIDLTAAASMISFDWSLRGKSLLMDVATCHPTEYLHWFNGSIHPVKVRPLVNDRRIDPVRKNLSIAQIDRMIETMAADARARLDRYSTISADLTAGQDTRAALALLLSVADRSQIVTRCRGEEGSEDVSVARRIADTHGLSFSATPLEPAQHDTFLAHADLLAFHANGDTSSKRAIGPLPQYEPKPPLCTGGPGGEIFRGFYYPRSGWTSLDRSSVDEALSHIKKKHSRYRKIKWREQEISAELELRCHSVVSELSELAETGWDILDLFYVYERIGVWGAPLAWHIGYWGPFRNRELLRLAFELPSPIGHHCLLNKTLVKRFMPLVYWLPVNGKELLAFEGPGLHRRTARKFYSSYASTRRRVKRLLYRSRPGTRSVDQQFAEAFAGRLADTVYDTLMAQGSIAINLFGAGNLNQLLEEHFSRRRDHRDVIGILITIEQWRSMIHKTYRMAKTNG